MRLNKQDAIIASLSQNNNVSRVRETLKFFQIDKTKEIDQKLYEEEFENDLSYGEEVIEEKKLDQEEEQEDDSSSEEKDHYKEMKDWINTKKIKKGKKAFA